MKEGIKGLGLSCPLLNIIHYQHVYCLIEVDEIVGGVVKHRLYILVLEEACADIQHSLLGISLLGQHTDGIDKMRLATT